MLPRDMHWRDKYIKTLPLNLLFSWLCACNPLAKSTDGKGIPAQSVQAAPPMPAAGATGGSSAGGSGGKPASSSGQSPFGSFGSTIIPATMPAGSSKPATTGSSTATAAANSGSAGTAASETAGTAAPTDTATAGASSAAAGTGATNPWDPATFDEAHGRSDKTAPPGTPVEEGGLMCANEVCKPLPALPDQAASMGASLSLCCTDEGECGTKGMGPMQMGDPNECHIIPDSDPQCARLEIMGFEIASCCTADGKCGLNGQNFMMAPCGSIEDAMASFGTFIMLPPPASCIPGMGPPHSSSAPAPGSSTGAAGMSTTTGSAGAAAPTAGMTGSASTSTAGAGGG
jgi:hypothetical protein